MTILGLPDPFADVAYADGINTDTAWTNSTTAEKENALQYARLYIEQNYFLYFDETSPPDQIKTANAMLAGEHVVSTLFPVEAADSPARGLTKKLVDADGVKVEKSYDSNASRVWEDPYPHITSLLIYDGYSRLKSGGGISYAPLVRR